MRILYLLFLVLSGPLLYAEADTMRIPISRVYFHDKIVNEQKLIDKLDGRQDGIYHPVNNEVINNMLTDALFRKVKNFNEWIERNDSIATNNEKVRYLTYVEQMLRNYRIRVRDKKIHQVSFSQLVNDFEHALYKRASGESLIALINEMPYPQADIIASVMHDAPEISEIRKLVYRKFAALYPDQILQTIRPFAQEPFADSLLVLAAKQFPAQLYTYAQSRTSPEGRLIHRSEHPLVKSIAQLSETPNALFYFPFLDNLISGKLTVEDIRKFVGDGNKEFDSVGYFGLLVKTSIGYYKRMAPPVRDTPIAVFGPNGLRETLRDRAIRHFVTPVNDLHNESNLNVRMRAIDSLNPVELYYMMVMGENDLYTSSYQHTFNRFLSRMGSKPRTDSLLMQVHFEHFKKFIRVAAGFNRLDTFLKQMPADRAGVLMKAFVSNLDKTPNLEDAVDVADSYGSITDLHLQQTILQFVEENYRKSINEDNERGKIIYGILREIFLSSDPKNNINLTASLGIPSIYEVDNAHLRDDQGQIVQQVFFYGDEDGKVFFPQFLNSFSPREWKITPKAEWVEIRSNNGKMMVFVNRPLDNDANLDDSAQVHLNAYLEKQGLQPTIVVHRGHSYWLPRTIQRMPSSARIVLLGSCGGYKNLNDILEVCPDAHIISTKEIGKGDLNQPIINYLNSSLAAGRNIAWRKMWQDLSAGFRSAPAATRSSWENYIPPYNNLGAIFLKAYKRRTLPD